MWGRAFGLLLLLLGAKFSVKIIGIITISILPYCASLRIRVTCMGVVGM
jgi:hypothetical protein